MTRNNGTSDHSRSGVTIRRLDDSDRTELELLASLDTSPTPAEPVIGALVEGKLLAAISLASGETVANPFSRTHELRSLLELRAAQLARRSHRQRRRAIRWSRRPARAALASSPPGGGGRLLTLLPRA